MLKPPRYDDRAEKRERRTKRCEVCGDTLGRLHPHRGGGQYLEATNITGAVLSPDGNGVMLMCPKGHLTPWTGKIEWDPSQVLVVSECESRKRQRSER